MDEKKSGRPKKFADVKTISFKVTEADYYSLKDLAASCGQTVSAILSEYVTGLVNANKRKIATFRRQKNSTVKATFATSSKPSEPAQIISDEMKAGEGDENH